MRVAILGFAGQGQSAYEYWNRDGNEITICDRDTSVNLPSDVASRLGEDYLKNLERFDLLVRTPALHPRDIQNANPDMPNILDKMTSVTNEFFLVCPSRNIIGITGTKGKGTTSTLIAKILEAAGKKVHLGGNIGIPPLDMLKVGIQADDWVVLELANFQLIDLRYSPPLAVCLMVEPEHQDWHDNLEEYITAKQQLFRWQKPEEIAIYYADSDNSKKVTEISAGNKIPYMKSPGAEVIDDKISIEGQTICDVKDLKLLGKHNWQNACAAVTAVWQIDKNTGAMRSVLTSFTGLEHRLELVREFDGAKYYDDSFGTTPETAIVAIEAFEQPKIVILGGSDKGATYEKLAKTVKEGNVRKAVVIGDTGPAIAEALKQAGFMDVIEGGKSMSEIMDVAKSHAQSGDVVLLSTGCASFGLFKNYKDRGEQFKKVVQELA